MYFRFTYGTCFILCGIVFVGIVFPVQLVTQAVIQVLQSLRYALYPDLNVRVPPEVFQLRCLRNPKNEGPSVFVSSILNHTVP